MMAQVVATMHKNLGAQIAAKKNHKEWKASYGANNTN